MKTPQILLSLIAISALQGAESAPADIDAGPLRLELHVSRTAHLFYVVDQLSCWDYFCHPEYVRGISPLNEADTAILEKHRTVRKSHPWGSGLEHTFFSDLDLTAALKRGVERGWLSNDDAKIELEVLSHFAPMVDALLATQGSILSTFVQRLQRDIPKLTDVAKQLQRFTGVSPETIHVFIFATPSDDNFGGGFNGGMLTLEIPRKSDPYPVLVHEVFHAFLKPLMAELARCAAGSEGLDAQTLNEGIAHAFAPGILHAEGVDPLIRDVKRGISQHKTLADPLTRYYRFALALRPILREALNDDKQTISDFLPRAVCVWKATQALAQAIDDTPNRVAERD